MTTLILGCGDLGSRVAVLLKQSGKPVIGTVRSIARSEALSRQGIKTVIADVLDPESLRVLPEADRVLYCVGQDRSAGVPMRRVYVDGLRNVLECLAGRVGRVVYASSTGVYGPCGGDWIDEDTPTHPTHESGRVVLDAELALKDVAERHGLPLVILRFAGLYGPGRIPLRGRLDRGEPIPGDPERPLNLVHIDDAAAAAVAALDRGKAGRSYLVSDDRPLPRREFYELAAQLLGAPEPRFVPYAPGSPEASREESSKRVRNARLRDELGVSLVHPDITTGLPAALSPSLPKIS
jgi:nucleoside-diphosphate-sugar epimerase